MKHFIIHLFGHIGATPFKQNRQNRIEGNHGWGHSNGLHGLEKLQGLFEEARFGVASDEGIEEPVPKLDGSVGLFLDGKKQVSSHI